MPASIVKVEANRRNAALSTGPRSDEGKEIVAGNALRHGLLSTRPVLAGIERAEDWHDHLVETVRSLAPAGHLEAVLAERVALCLWRLGRAARYEHEAIALVQEGADAGEAAAAAEVARVTELRGLLDRLPRLAADDPVPTPAAAAVVQSLAGVLQLSPDRAYAFRRPAWLPAGTDPASFDGWTAARVREFVDARSADARRKPEAIWRALAAHAAERSATLDRRSADAARLLANHRRANLLPSDAQLNKVTRYEASLERSLYKALHELQRMQAARQGQHVPPPVAVDVTGDEGGGEVAR